MTSEGLAGFRELIFSEVRMRRPPITISYSRPISPRTFSMAARMTVAFASFRKLTTGSLEKGRTSILPSVYRWVWIGTLESKLSQSMAQSPITTRCDDFAAWYQDVVLQGDLAEPAEIVKGCMVIKPNGYAVWEVLQREFDTRFKATGHQNP